MPATSQRALISNPGGSMTPGFPHGVLRIRVINLETRSTSKQVYYEGLMPPAAATHSHSEWTPKKRSRSLALCGGTPPGRSAADPFDADAERSVLHSAGDRRNEKKGNSSPRTQAP